MFHAKDYGFIEFHAVLTKFLIMQRLLKSLRVAYDT